MTELSALNIRITGDADGLKAATAVATGELGKVGAAAEAANTGTGKLAGGFGKLGSMSGQTRNQLRMTGMQLSQVGQQTMATGNFVQALAIQLPDIGLGFGMIGTAAGLLAGIALPMLVSAFSNSGDEARDFADINSDLVDAINAMRAAGEGSLKSLADLAEKYGTAAANAQTFLSAIADVERLKAVNALNEAIASVATQFGGLDVAESGLSALEATTQKLRDDMELTGDNLLRVRNALDALKNAKGVQEQLEAANGLQNALISIYGSIEAMPEPARLLYENIATAGANAALLVGSAQSAGIVIGGAADEAKRLADNLFAAAQQQLAAEGKVYSGRGGDPRTSNDKGKGKFSYTPPKGGNGGAVSPLFGELEKLQTTLATEGELVAIHYADQQETLQAALDARLITQQEFQDLSAKSAEQYRAAMAGINSGYHGDALDQAGAFFGDMANAMQSGNDKMLKIARVFGAAEALINAFRAYNQVIADPTLPWFAKIPAAMGVLSAGMGMVNAIKGGGGGGGGGGGAGSGGGATQQRVANINFVGGFQPTAQTIEVLANGLNDWLGDGGQLNVGGAS